MNGPVLELVPAQGTLPILSVKNSETKIEPYKSGNRYLGGFVEFVSHS
jgi:hypothetical protein